MKRIPIGIDNFKEIIDDNYYYIDKTLMIKEILESGAKATLITRPRRFGKSLNMSMLKYFFEDRRDANGDRIDNAYLFDNLYISKQEQCWKEQGKYPVINLTFKACTSSTWNETYGDILSKIRDEFRDHWYLLNGAINVADKELFKKIIEKKADKDEYKRSVLSLCRMLSEYHKQPCIVLLDEYDVPLQNAYVRGFYDEAIDFIKQLLEESFKQNNYMKFGVITGCLRISKESIFTGWNNVDVCTIIGEQYLEDYGVTIDEKNDLLKYYNMQDDSAEIKQWYDGYNFNGVEIYNPWDLLKYIKDKLINPKKSLQSYWINTSSNSILQEALEVGNRDIKLGIQELFENGYIEEPINESLTYGYLKAEPENIWSLLLFSGYLTAAATDNKDEYKLWIPNNSIKECYKKQINTYFESQIKSNLASDLEQLMIDNKGKEIEIALRRFLKLNISYYDDLEAFYHGFIAGLCTAFPNYEISSNKELGNGRVDIALEPNRDNIPGIILEFKRIEKDSKEDLDAMALTALKQIDAKKYTEEFIVRDITVRKFGIAFQGKECRVAWDKGTSEIKPLALCKYLEKNKWESLKSKRDDIRAYYLESIEDFYQVSIPLDKNASNYEAALNKAINTIAEAMTCKVEDVVEAVKM